MADPTSKMKKKTRKVHYIVISSKSNSQPHRLLKPWTKSYLDGKLAINLAAERLERCTSELIGTAIPEQNKSASCKNHLR